MLKPNDPAKQVKSPKATTMGKRFLRAISPRPPLSKSYTSKSDKVGVFSKSEKGGVAPFMSPRLLPKRKLATATPPIKLLHERRASSLTTTSRKRLEEKFRKVLNL